MAGNPLASLPGLPQRPSLARSSASETRLTQPGIEAARSRKLNSAPTAAFRMNETRKIAAILAADVVGFSRMASADEDRTLARLLNPNFTVKRFRLGAESDNSVFLAQREHLLDGMRKARIP